MFWKLAVYKKNKLFIGHQMEMMWVDVSGTSTVLRCEFLLYTYWPSGTELQTEIVIVTGLIPEILAAQINN